MSGWTCAYRKIWDHPLFKGNALRVGVWQWMIHKAAWAPVRFNVGGATIDLDRGQLCVSQAQICAETGITRKQLRTLISALEAEHAVVTKPANDRANAKTIITICKYNDYQYLGQDKGQDVGQARAKQGPTKEQKNKITKEILCAPAVQFDDFWQAYPHRGGAKKGRAGAEKSYARALASGVAEQDLIDAAVRYGHDRMVRDGYAKDPATWLNQKGWADEIEPAPLRAVTKTPEYGDMRQRPDGTWQTYHPFEGWMRTHV
jgi:hypothetical protein